MGGSNYSDAAYTARATTRAATATPVFAHDAAIRSGAAPRAVHADLNPRGVAFRESRDSDVHPVAIPIAVIMDTTGSMAQVPQTLEARLPALMGTLLNDKASGKAYLGDGYPAIMIGALDDYHAMGGDGSGTLQVGQFESGLEIDENLEKLWLTGRGGGTYQESYELALLFMARHTVHDHMEKRGRRGYCFLIGDEMAYDEVSPSQAKAVIGDTLQEAIPLRKIIEEVQEKYHLFFIIPNLTQHYADEQLSKWWMERLGQQNVLRLEDPQKICELIASTVALCEEYIGIDDLDTDDLSAGGVRKALVPLSRLAKSGGGGGLARYSADALPPVVGDVPAVERD